MKTAVSNRDLVGRPVGWVLAPTRRPRFPRVRASTHPTDSPAPAILRQRRGARRASILMIALAAWLAVGSMAAAQAPGNPKPTGVPAPAARVGITSLEQFLGRTLKTHPDIVAAEAEVELAQAKLTQTRFQIAHELITLWNDWQAQSEHVKHLQAEIDAGVAGRPATIGQLAVARARVAEIESLLPYLLGQAGGTPTVRSAALPPGPKQAPSGPVAYKILEALNQPAELSFSGAASVRNAADVLSRHHDIRVVVDPEVADLPATLDIRGIPLGAALQEAEVFTPGIRFVVCDFGILVTSDTSTAASAFISAHEFWKERAEKEGVLGPRPEEFLRALRGASPGSSPRKPFGGRGGFPGGGRSPGGGFGGRKKPPSDAKAPGTEPPAPSEAPPPGKDN